MSRAELRTSVETWRPAFRGYQRMRVVSFGPAEFAIEAELDGEIAVGFDRWPEANAFLVGLQEAQRGSFM